MKRKLVTHKKKRGDKIYELVHRHTPPSHSTLLGTYIVFCDAPTHSYTHKFTKSPIHTKITPENEGKAAALPLENEKGKNSPANIGKARQPEGGGGVEKLILN